MAKARPATEYSLAHLTNNGVIAIMNLTLVRKLRRPDGIISDLYDGELLIAQTLEHSYLQPDGRYDAKISPGFYVCRRGPHRLHNMTQDFETFEITGVVGHTNILFHWGNYNADSEGCVLVGTSYAVTPQGVAMITASRGAFARLMDHANGLNEFTLTVREPV